MSTEISPAVNSDTLPQKRSEFGQFLRVLLARKTVVISLLVLLLLVLTAIFAPVLAPHDPYEQNLGNILQKPDSTHWLGTDHLGRDVLSRIIYGSRASLLAGIASVLIAGVGGVLLGVIAGYFGRWIDSLIMRIMDALMAIPATILALSLGAAMGGGLNNVIVAIGIALMPTYARLMRGQVLSVREADFVIASELSGASNSRNIIVHIIPNCISPIIVLATLNLGIAILAEAALSFLGLGIAPPGAAWGSMINDGYVYLRTFPLLSFAPGVCVAIVVLAFNIVGDALRDALDPKLRGAL